MNQHGEGMLGPTNVRMADCLSAADWVFGYNMVPASTNFVRGPHHRSSAQQIAATQRLADGLSPTIRHLGAESGSQSSIPGLRAWEFRPAPPYLCCYHGPGPRLFRRSLRLSRASVCERSGLFPSPVIFSCASVMRSTAQ
jgi:hypothetical protein